MRLKEFPDIQWLRKQAKNNFQDGRGVNNQPLPQQGWPSVVLNTTSFGAERNGIKGPFSVFLNMKGQSLVKSGGKSITLTEDNLCITNKADFYDLIIPEGQRTNTFNIHFGEMLYHQVLKHSTSTTDQLLNDPFDSRNHPYQTHIKSIWKNERVKSQLQILQAYYNTQNDEEDSEYELLAELLSTILSNQAATENQSVRINSLKRSTKQELLSRVSLSVDYIHANYKEPISLDELGAIACLSKYHYLRTFKSIHGCTPLQMIAQLRFEKATAMLRQSSLPVTEIAPSLGFSELAAFTRFFKKMSGQTPSTIRKCS